MVVYSSTLAAGFISQKTNSFKFYLNVSCFLTSPDRFFLNYYPMDEYWFLIKKNKNDFAKLPLFYDNYFQNNYQLSKADHVLLSTSESENLIFAIKGLDE